MVDKSNKVVIDSPETIKALEYSRELYGTFVPGTLSWLDPNNNKAFLDGQISVTNNGISIYYAAKNSQDPKIKELVPDINHAEYPSDRPAWGLRSTCFLNQMIFKYTQVSEGGQGIHPLHDGGGAVRPLDAGGHRLCRASAAAVREEPDLDCGSEAHAVPRRGENMRPAGYEGKLGYASAGALADFIIVDMVPKPPPAQSRPRRPQSARKNALSATTRCEAASGEQERPRAAVMLPRALCCSPSSPTRSALAPGSASTDAKIDALASG